MVTDKATKCTFYTCMVYNIFKNNFHYFYLENKRNLYFLMSKGKTVQFKISEYYKQINFGEKVRNKKRKTEELKVMGFNVRKMNAI